jgi:hypothetical protein
MKIDWRKYIRYRKIIIVALSGIGAFSIAAAFETKDDLTFDQLYLEINPFLIAFGLMALVTALLLYKAAE